MKILLQFAMKAQCSRVGASLDDIYTYLDKCFPLSNHVFAIGLRMQSIYQSISQSGALQDKSDALVSDYQLNNA